LKVVLYNFSKLIIQILRNIIYNLLIYKYQRIFLKFYHFIKIKKYLNIFNKTKMKEKYDYKFNKKR
jgi:hypothetical protein